MLTTILAVAGAIALMHFVVLLIVVSRLVKMPMWAPLIQVAPRPANDQGVVLMSAGLAMEAAGFRYMYSRRSRGLVASKARQPSYCDVYYHRDEDVHAEVFLASVPTPTRVYDVYLWNTFVDNKSLLTVDGRAHELIPYPKSVMVADGYTGSLEGQLATHLAARMKISVPRTSSHEALLRAQAFAETMLDAMAREGSIYLRGRGHKIKVYGFRFATAVKAAIKLRFLPAKAKKIAKASTTPVSSEVRAAAERVAFGNTLATLSANRAPRWFRWSVFMFSALAFLAIGTWFWDLTYALMIAAIVAFHEAGHWLAMRMAKFRDVQVFFIPGMGGATSGVKHDASPLTHLLVYLAGPMPGLLLATVVFVLMYLNVIDLSAPWTQTLVSGAYVAFFINGLNMLPVMPLDGGRIFNLFALSRLPWLRFAFAVGSGGLLLLWGMSTGDRVTITLGIIFLFSVQYQYRLGKATADLLKEKLAGTLPPNDLPEVTARMYNFFSQKPYQKWDYKAKLSVGQSLLPVLMSRLPTAKETIAGLAIYFGCLVLPIIAIVCVVLLGSSGTLPSWRPSGADRTAAAVRDNADPAAIKAARDADMAELLKPTRDARAAKLAAAKGDDRLRTLAEVAEEAVNDEDSKDALRYAKSFYEAAGAVTPPAFERAKAASLLATAMDMEAADDAVRTANRPEREGLNREAENILRQRLAAKTAGEDAILLAHVLETRLKGDDAAADLAVQQEITSLLSANKPASDMEVVTAHAALAKRLADADQADAAEREYQQALAGAAGEKGAYLNGTIKLQYGGFLLERKRFDEAEKLVAPLAALNAGDPIPASAHRRNAQLFLAISAQLRGDWQRARELATEARKPLVFESDSWVYKFLNLFQQVNKPQPDLRATLLLINAERSLGNTAVADGLVAELKHRMPQYVKDNPACRFANNLLGNSQVYRNTLLTIEKREFNCTDAKAVPQAAK